MPPTMMPVQPVEPPRRSRAWILPVVLVSVIAVIGLGVLAFQALKPKTTTVLVTLELYNGTDGCNVGLGYNDVPGASVVIEADGVPVGASTLDLRDCLRECRDDGGDLASVRISVRCCLRPARLDADDMRLDDFAGRGRGWRRL